MSTRNLSTLAILFIIISNGLFAQKAPFKFGKVEPAEIEMTTYELDTSASAVILYDYGVFDPDMISFKRILRIKILKKEGYKFVNKVYPGADKTVVRGITYNLENGVVIEDKLKNESIFKERITEDYFRLRITMPNVKVGSVCDIEFSYSGFPLIWEFQDEIPVKWSEIWLPTSPYYDFRKTYFGQETLFLAQESHWIAKDMPAFKEEPFMNSINNYVSKFEIDILRVHFTEYTTDWDAVARRLNTTQYFGQLIGSPIFLNEVANNIKSKETSEYEKVKAAYEAVKVVKWNKDESLYANATSLLTPYKEKIGNSAEINLILINLLRKLDIESYPVILSTRENGLLSPAFPSIFKLNYIIAYVKIGEKEFLMDATEELMPLGLIPERCLNGVGQRIDNEKATLVDLKTDKKDKSTEMFDLELVNENILKGKVTTRRLDYNAFNFRKKFQSFNSKEEYIDYLENSVKGLEIEDYKIENQDSIYLPINEEYSVQISNQVYKIDDKIYINPLLYNRLEENPFKNDTRKYPIDFIYRSEKTSIYKIKLPENYSVVEIPTPISITLPDKSASITYQIAITGNTINITYKFNINKETFLPSEYQNIKELFSQIIKKQSEPIIIKTI